MSRRSEQSAQRRREREQERERRPVHDERRCEARGNWWLVRVPLRDGWQALARCGFGFPLLIIDDAIPDEALDRILIECDAAARGDWENAPHARRAVPPEPDLYIVR